MRVDQYSTTGLGTSASSDGAVLMPYNAPSTGDFTQVMNSVSQDPQTTPQQQQQSSQSGASASSTSGTPTTGSASGTPASGSAPVPSSTAIPTPSFPFMPLPPGTAGTTGTTGGTGTAGTTGTPNFPDTRAGMMEAAAYGFALALAQSPASGSDASTTAADSLSSLMSGASPSSTAGLSATGATTATTAATSATGATFALPFHGSPTITQPFGPTSYTAEPSYDGYSHFHTGIDFGVPLGTPILAAAGGKVVSAGWDTTGFGNKVVIDHGNGLETLYGHLEQIDVKPGDVVQAGQVIALSGSTGNSSGPHLHFGVEKDGQWVNPAPYLAGTSSASSTSSTSSTPTSSDSATATTMATTAATTVAASPATPASGDDNSISALIARASAATGVDKNLIAAVVQAESAGDPQAVSQAGAKGLMQLMDSTAAGYGVTNPFDPAQNVMAGARYLHDLLDRFNGDKTLAVAAYNAGPGAVEQYGGIPPYPETQQYVQRVLGLQQQYASSAANSSSATTGVSA